MPAAPRTFGYGDPRGQESLRTALADYLGRARGVVTTPDNIVVTTSYAQSLALMCVGPRAGSGGAWRTPDSPTTARSSGGPGCAWCRRTASTSEDWTSTACGADAVVDDGRPPVPHGRHARARTTGRADPMGAGAAGWSSRTTTTESSGTTGSPSAPCRARRRARSPTWAEWRRRSVPALRIGWMALPPHLVGPATEAKRYCRPPHRRAAAGDPRRAHRQPCVRPAHPGGQTALPAASRPAAGGSGRPSGTGPGACRRGYKHWYYCLLTARPRPSVVARLDAEGVALEGLGRALAHAG